LCLPEGCPVYGGGDSACIVSPFQGVFYRHCGNAGPVIKSGKITSVDYFPADQWSGTVMNQDNCGIVVKCFETGQNRVLASASSGHYCQVCATYFVAVEQYMCLVNPFRGDNHHNTLDVAVIDKGTNGMDENWYAGQQMVLFRVIKIHSGPESGGGNYGGC
jgi:hypothetical protein